MILGPRAYLGNTQPLSRILSNLERGQERYVLQYRQ